MKVTVERTSIQPLPNPPHPSDLPSSQSFPRRPPVRRTKAPGAGVRLRREPGAPPAKRGSRPETPLLSWKFDKGGREDFPAADEYKSGSEVDRKSRRRRIRPEVSARKLAAGLWRLHTPEFQINVGQRVGGFQSGVGHFGGTLHCHHHERVHNSPAKDLLQSPRSVSGPNELLFNKFDPSFHSMEGATKWDPHGWKAPDESSPQTFSCPKHPQRRPLGPTALNPALETELVQARARIDELEADRRSSKKKLEQFLHKLGEERAAWRSREHEKVRAIMDDVKADLAHESKTRKRLEAVNSKLVDELANVRLSAKRLAQEYEKEHKARSLVEEVCDELAKEIGEDKAEVEALKRECGRLREEVEEERRMLQMAEVWREERVQMKLVDAKVMLEEKYAEMTAMVERLESFLSSGGGAGLGSGREEIEKAEFLIHVAKSVNIQDVRELAYEPPNPDDIFSIFEDGDINGAGGGGNSPTSRASKIHTVSPEVKVLARDGARHAYADQSGELLEGASEWETVSNPEDQGSSYSPEESDPSINSRNFRARSVSRNMTEWETDESGRMVKMVEVDSRQMKRASSISKLWRTCPDNGDGYKIMSLERKNGRPSNGKISNGSVFSPDNGLGFNPLDFSGQWSSPDSGYPHMKGCIEWPRGADKSSLKARLLEARMNGQKVQLRQVLKQKI